MTWIVVIELFLRVLMFMLYLNKHSFTPSPHETPAPKLKSNVAGNLSSSNVPVTVHPTGF